MIRSMHISPHRPQPPAQRRGFLNPIPPARRSPRKPRHRPYDPRIITGGNDTFPVVVIGLVLAVILLGWLVSAIRYWLG